MEALEKKQLFSDMDGQVKVVPGANGPEDGVKVQLHVPRSAFRLAKPKCLAVSVRRAMLSVSNLRIIVLSIAVTYLTTSSIVLFMSSLALMQIYHACDRLDTDRQDHKEREEYTETPRIHGISTNDIRFMEADRMLQSTISLMWFVFLSAAMYTCVSISLVAGVIKRCHAQFLPWIIAQSIFMTFLFVLLISSLISDDLFDKYVRDTISTYPDRTFVLMIWFFLEGISMPLVAKYYHQLKLTKKHTADAVVPSRIVPKAFRKPKRHMCNGIYKHHLTDDNPNYVV